MKRALICGAAILAFAGGAAAEGYVSGNYVDLDGDDSWSINGRYLLGEHVLLDAGYTGIDGDVDLWRFGGHAFARGTDWLLGGYAGYESIDAGSSNDEWVVAAEGQYHVDRMTLAATVAYSELEASPITFEMWNVGGTLRYFLTDNFSLEGNAAWLNTEISPVGASADGSVLGLGAEYQFDGAPVGIFAGYRHTDIGGGAEETDTWGAGIRWNFGEGTLMQRDRSGARLRRPETVFEVLIGGGSLD